MKKKHLKQIEAWRDRLQAVVDELGAFVENETLSDDDALVMEDIESNVVNAIDHCDSQLSATE